MPAAELCPWAPARPQAPGSRGCVVPGPQHPWVLRGITLPKPCTPPCPQGQAVRPGHPRIAHGKLCISSITGWFGDAWGERMGMGQDEAPSSACSGSPQTSGSPPRRLLLGCPLPHPQLPNPLSPPPARPRSPRAWHRRGRGGEGGGGGGSPGGGTVPGPPGLPGDAGSCGRSWRAQP